MIYAAHFNYDYEESFFSTKDPERLLAKIIENFEVDASVDNPGLEEMVNETYADGKWKGFTVHAIHSKTGKSREISIANVQLALSNHGKLKLQDSLQTQLGKAA